MTPCPVELVFWLMMDSIPAKIGASKLVPPAVVRYSLLASRNPLRLYDVTVSKPESQMFWHSVDDPERPVLIVMTITSVSSLVTNEVRRCSLTVLLRLDSPFRKSEIAQMRSRRDLPEHLRLAPANGRPSLRLIFRRNAGGLDELQRFLLSVISLKFFRVPNQL
jgi:hypothetical protein